MALILNLDEAATDENLPKLGEIFVDVAMSHNFDFEFFPMPGVEYTARIIGDGNFFTNSSYSTSAGKSVTQTTNRLWLSSGTYKLGIAPKYRVMAFGGDLPNLTDLNGLAVDCSQFKYCLEHTFSLSAQHWKLTNISGDNMSMCSMLSANGATSVNFDVAEFKKMTHLENFNVSNTDVYGDLVDACGAKLNLTRLIASNTACTGTHGAIADAMFANGRTSGQMVVSVPDGAGVKTVTFSPSGWTEA